MFERECNWAFRVMLRLPNVNLSPSSSCWSSRVRFIAFTFVTAFTFGVGCAVTVQPTKTPTLDDPLGMPASPLRVERVDPMAGGGAIKPSGLAALEQEMQRGMKELGGKGKPPPYYIAYEIHDRNDVTVAASYGALVQSSVRHSRILDTDVRVGDYKLD